MNFITKTLAIELKDAEMAVDVISKTKSIVNKYEPHVVVKEKAVKTHRNHRHHEEHEHDHHEHEHDHDHSHGEGSNNREFIRILLGGAVYAAALVFKTTLWADFTLFLISYVIVGGEVVLRALRNILRGRVFDENFLMTIATVGAFAIGEFPEGVAVMLFYQIGEFFQDIAVNQSRKSITELMDIRPDYANLKIGKGEKRVSPEEVKVGDVILVKPGERVPLDGKILEGASMVDTSALTGESVPREVEVGSEVLGGFINKNGVLAIAVSREFGESTVAKILDLVQNASSRKAPTENFITKFARYYTPVVVYTALAIAAIPPIFIEGAEFSNWLYRALIFLVISCPCALVISIPLGFFGGIGGASRRGILIKGSNYLEALNNVETVVFDKTGTLTKGVFKVTEIKASKGFAQEELVEYAAHAESYSNHPIAQSILQHYKGELDKGAVEAYEEISGYGVRITYKGKEILAGNKKLMLRENISRSEVDAAGTVVHVAVDKVYAGYIVISDEVKEDSKRAIAALKSLGVKKTVMLTGDLKAVGERVGRELGLDEVHAELLPDQKVERLEELDKKKSPRGKLVFVGDGINDAPVLARADIGIAMGGLGSDAAIEAADVVIMNDEPSKIADAIGVAKRTRNIVWQNIIFAMGVKLIVLLLGAGGIATMWEAVFADVGVALIAVLNSMRVMRK